MTSTMEIQEAARRYVEAFEAFAGTGAGPGPAWLQERRREAIARFAEAGFPTTRQEEWRFTDVKPIATTAFRVAPPLDPGALSRDALAEALGEVGRPGTAVFVNGRFAEALSSLEGMPGGVRVGSLARALEEDPELVGTHLAAHAEDGRNPFTALNTAFVQDGGFVYLPPGVVLREPLRLVFLALAAGDGPAVWHPRILLVAGEGAEGSVVEQYAAVGRGTYWVNAVTEAVVGDNARLDCYRIQRDALEAYHTAATHSVQGRDSAFSLVAFAFGGALTRHDITAVLDGDGGDCTLDGLTLVGGRQHVDFHTTLDHAKPHCTSWEFFNGVFDGRARGVFNGRIVVRAGAQKTDSKQTNNNLLLSRRARADSQPQLEIYADDVKCTHGATLGPIDERQVFYLQARGLDRVAARNLLTYGFCAEILANVKPEVLRRELDELVRSRLADGARERENG